jgi:hypothetical protein
MLSRVVVDQHHAVAEDVAESLTGKVSGGSKESSRTSADVTAA